MIQYNTQHFLNPSSISQTWRAANNSDHNTLMLQKPSHMPYQIRQGNIWQVRVGQIMLYYDATAQDKFMIGG